MGCPLGINRRKAPQLQHNQQLMKNNINDYKNQLVDTIAEHDPNHKVEQQLLKPNEVPEAFITTNGRQQHLRQSLKYLLDVTSQVLQKIKTTATNFINQVTKTLLPPINPQKPTQLQKVNEQTKKSIKQQIDDEWER